MKKLLKILLTAVVIIAAAFFAAAGIFYKNAAPSLIADMSKTGENSSAVCSEMFSPEFKDESSLKSNAGNMTSGFWTSKWCLDMGEKTMKSVHYDFSGYSFAGYLRDLKDFNFSGFKGAVSASSGGDEINIICSGGSGSARVVLRSMGKTKLAGKTLEIKIEEAVYKGKSGEPSLPVVLRDYTSGAGDKLEVDLKQLDKNNIYRIKITEADPLAAPAYENKNPPKRYSLSKSLSSEINIREDGEYSVDCVYKKADADAYFELYVDGEPFGGAQAAVSSVSSCASSGIALEKGKHTVRIVSEEQLPEFENIVVSPKEDNENVYIAPEDESSGLYLAAAPREGSYSLTSTELEGGITVNSAYAGMNELGAAQIYLNKGINEIKLDAKLPSDLKITKISE